MQISKLLLFLSLFLFVPLCITTCVCPYDNCKWYTGSESDCLCWCNNNVNKFETTKLNCSYKAWGDRWDGYCRLCDSSKSPKESLKMLPVKFPIYSEICPNDNCMEGFGGTKEQCEAYCKKESNWFINNTISKIQYIAPSKEVNGYCYCEGWFDPCNMPESVETNNPKFKKINSQI
ncbi:hypothetical protein M0812_28408 [Anaeramoeba flamelloides]|uniref:Uncharacterized protein n=1 Tax=Anaeramoeba flamelloides TaxID=1746091 RepID=A0AAV7YAF6_9EUKA|nr:hypothetical protein M0812_28408 [Anaeramoeba flamelloides]